MNIPRKVVFLIFSKTHLLDLAGPAQVFYEANNIGGLGLEIIFASPNPESVSEQGLSFAKLNSPENITLTSCDFLVIPGIDFASFKKGELQEEIHRVGNWLRKQSSGKVHLASICSGTLILAETRILNGFSCTSHWKCIDYIKKQYPKVNILTDRLFVKDRNIYTSAGMTSGMDMSLAILEELYGPILSSKVAREMVIFMRRDKASKQESVYLDYQTHFNPAIHQVQNYIISHPEENPTLDELAKVANMSARNLTRMFKEVTGHTVIEFKQDVKAELARTLLNNPDYTLETIASKCGYENVRQLQRVWNQKYGKSMSAWRKQDMLA
ncbi:MAG: DJ-1/PfpI family protein [Balneolales bacterium]